MRACGPRLPLASLVCALALPGCATPYFMGKAPAALPPLSIDVAASEVSSEIGDAEEHRGRIAEFLESLSARGDLPRRPARFRAKVRGETSYGHLLLSSFTYCLAYMGALYNCTYTNLDRSIEIELEVDGKRYTGSGWANRFSSVWFNVDGYHSLKEATEIAVRRGLEAGPYRAPNGLEGDAP
jgi:hypothetical protein